MDSLGLTLSGLAIKVAEKTLGGLRRTVDRASEAYDGMSDVRPIEDAARAALTRIQVFGGSGDAINGIRRFQENLQLFDTLGPMQFATMHTGNLDTLRSFFEDLHATLGGGKGGPGIDLVRAEYVNSPAIKGYPPIRVNTGQAIEALSIASRNPYRRLG